MRKKKKNLVTPEVDPMTTEANNSKTHKKMKYNKNLLNFINNVYSSGRLRQIKSSLGFTMVLLLDGNSEKCSHVRNNISYLICLRHSIRSRSIFFYELPSNTSTMGSTFEYRAMPISQTTGIPISWRKTLTPK